jgi:hypothetical protein
MIKAEIKKKNFFLAKKNQSSSYFFLGIKIDVEEVDLGSYKKKNKASFFEND